jgi:hypothetical protein
MSPDGTAIAVASRKNQSWSYTGNNIWLMRKNNFGDWTLNFRLKYRIQRPNARPFYCSYYDDDDNPEILGNNFFSRRHSWYFHKLPDQISIATNRLFTPSDWQWSATDGLIP